MFSHLSSWYICSTYSYRLSILLLSSILDMNPPLVLALLLLLSLSFSLFPSSDFYVLHVYTREDITTLERRLTTPSAAHAEVTSVRCGGDDNLLLRRTSSKVVRKKSRWRQSFLECVSEYERERGKNETVTAGQSAMRAS